MPTYDYKCEKCGHTFEESLKVVDRGAPTESPCESQIHRASPICGGKVKQIIVKASGFAYDNIRTKHSKKEPSWFKDRMKDIKKNHPGNTL
ncbi:MAG: zinc ribbon domain-containing protein [Thaumarchaeota archaeon]|nr:zinc ribbon domain-containing protein [Nitrososphaerota archaeon]